VFTDERGAVVLIEDDLARALGYDDPDDAVGDPLAATLGLAAAEAEALLNEISTSGGSRYRLAQLRNQRTGRSWWVMVSGSAAVADGRFIGADITLTPPAYTLSADYLTHRYNLRQLAELVRSRLRDGRGLVISEEKERELRSYFAARMLALYVLVVRMAGGDLGATLEEKVRRLNRERGWSMDMRRGRVTFGEADLPPEAWREIAQVAQSYAVSVTSKRIVARELGELDVNFSPATVQRATQYGLRTEL
jgi:hypothetical protein